MQIWREEIFAVMEMEVQRERELGEQLDLRGAFTGCLKIRVTPGSAGRLQIIIFGTPGEIRRQTSAWSSKGSYAKNNH